MEIAYGGVSRSAPPAAPVVDNITSRTHYLHSVRQERGGMGGGQEETRVHTEQQTKWQSGKASGQLFYLDQVLLALYKEVIFRGSSLSHFNCEALQQS